MKGVILSSNEFKYDYPSMSDFDLANCFYNNLQYNADDSELQKFYQEVDKRKGGMLRSEWLDYVY